MSHINLRFFVQGDPQRHARMRQRKRLLKPVRPSKADELWYKAQLLGLTRHLRAMTEQHVLPSLKQLDQARTKSGDAMAVGDGMPIMPAGALDTLLANATRQFVGIGQVAKRLANQVAQKSLFAVDDRLSKSVQSSLGVDISPALTTAGPIQAAMQAAIEANMQLITSIPDQYFDRIKQVISDGMQNGTSYDDMAEQIGQIANVTDSRAKLIARDQTSKMNGNFNQVRQTSLGISRYQWSTSGDERVRDTHAANEGLEFSWDDPPAETGHPGNDINCRCVAIPVFDLDGDDDDESADSGA